MRNRISLIILCLLVMGFLEPVLAAPAEQSATAELVVGRVELSRGSSNKWRAVKTGAKVRHRDQLRTFAGAQLDIRLSSGSQLTMQENSLLDLSELLEESGHLKQSVQVRKGKVLFSIQKLTTAQSSFTFETPTATAAIRGTEGGIALLNSGMAAYLESGRMELTDRSGNSTALLGSGLLVTQNASGFELFQLPDGFSGSDLIDRINDEGLPQLLGQLDQLPITSWVVEQPARGSSVTGPFVLSGFGVPGTKVDVGEASAVVGDDRSWSINLPARSALGPFTLKLRLVAGNDEQLLEWPLVALSDAPKEAAIFLESPTSVEIRDGVLNIAGRVEGGEGELLLQIGETSRQVPVLDNRFSSRVEISDVARTWEATEAVLYWNTASGRAVQTIALQIDQQSPKVNTIVPEPQLDVVNGRLRIGVAQMNGDRGSLQLLASGEEIYHAELSGNLSGREVPMRTGVHDYRLIAKDQAGNQKERQLKERAYWPRAAIRVDLSVSGHQGSVKVPPLPPGSDPTQLLPMTVRIYNLPDDDPRALKRIEVTNGTTNFRRVLTGHQIDNVILELDVPVRRNAKNRVVVKVEPQNGMTVVGQKMVELGR